MAQYSEYYEIRIHTDQGIEASRLKDGTTEAEAELAYTLISDSLPKKRQAQLMRISELVLAHTIT